MSARPDGPCPFCQPDPDRVFYEDSLVCALWDGYPVTEGHALIVPKRHVATWFDATAEERAALNAATDAVREELERRYNPAGFNIGINVGEAAGQTVFHLHVHVIPRYVGDVEDPTGGVRYVIPSKANYRRGQLPPRSPQQAAPRLTVGGEVPLLPWLGACFETARAADIAVAFIQRSGLDAIEPYLLEFLERKGQLRLVTGDYLDITDPDALESIIDIQEEYRDRVAARVFQSGTGGGFHPKAYAFQRRDGSSVCYVGSANLTRAALQGSVEWCFRIESTIDPRGVVEVERAFGDLWEHPACTSLSREWISEYRKRRPARSTMVAVEVPPEPPPETVEPFEIQGEALDELTATRQRGNKAGLVVMATGLGKTWLAAFDALAVGAKRILFVAHREEILRQAKGVFRRVLPGATFANYSKGEHDTGGARVLFASVLTLGRQAHLERFAPDTFDYIVVDEFHHAAAASYRRLIRHFTPEFLLGLTATPERADGGSLLTYCGENVVYRCDLHEAIERKELCPFEYFGVPDEIDYQNIPWRGRRFDEEALSTAWATQARAENALSQHKKRAGKRTLAFCCSVAHARFMRDFFAERGLRAAAVHSGDESAPRSSSLESLAQGELDIIFSVDMFNEGVDIPAVDTVMMLRPTESPVIFLQQLGRGLRKAEGKKHLTVIDYIGNHRSFLIKPQALLGIEAGRPEKLREALARAEAGELDLPDGCKVTYELEVIELLKMLVPRGTAKDTIQSWYEASRDNLEERPRLADAFHAGISRAVVKRVWGSWIDFLITMGDLDEAALPRDAWTFLRDLEPTNMEKSYKMVLLQAALDKDGLPEPVAVDDIARRALQIVRGNEALMEDFAKHAQDLQSMRACLVKNPIHFLMEGRGMGGRRHFVFEDDRFGIRHHVPAGSRDLFRHLIAEIVEARLAEYLSGKRQASHKNAFWCKVFSNKRHAILKLDRSRYPNIPEGETELLVDGERYVARFVKIALNTMYRVGGSENALPEVLTRWFGPDAGKAGTAYRVRIERRPDGSLEMLPGVNPGSRASG